MPTNKLNVFLKAFAIGLIVLLFAVIRAFESELFYDPFLDYFKSDFKNIPFPELNLFDLGMNIFYRYFFNMIVSLLLLFVIFRDKSIVKFSAILYSIFFLILIVLFYLVLILKGVEGVWLLFYIRRFLIQPIFVLLFIPAFYYQLRVR